MYEFIVEIIYSDVFFCQRRMEEAKIHFLRKFTILYSIMQISERRFGSKDQCVFLLFLNVSMKLNINTFVEYFYQIVGVTLRLSWYNTRIFKKVFSNKRGQCQ